MKFRLGLLLSVILFLLGLDLLRFADEIAQVSGKTSQQTVALVAVLTGGQGRLKEALSDFSEGRGQYLLISGVAENASLDDILKANAVELSSKELRQRIIIDTHSLSTVDNVRFIVGLLQREQLRSVRLITSNYHMPRTLKLFQKERNRVMGATAEISVDSVGVESPNFPSASWWTNLTSWQILFSEYFKSRAS